MASASFEETRLIILPQRLDKTLAYKTINFLEGLSNNDRRVGTMLVDSFNGKTGRCDPSLERIALMLRISERTVIRAVNRLVTRGLFVRHRHGSYSNRNSYQPVWSRFRQAEDGWLTRSRATSNNSKLTKLSPGPGQDCHSPGDGDVTQNLTSNPSNSTPGVVAAPSASPHSSEMPIQKGPPSKENRQFVDRVIISSVHPRQRPLDAARSAAERRWNADLLARYGSQPEALAEVIDGVDALMREAATDAELQCRGAGLKLIHDRLRERRLTKHSAVGASSLNDGDPR